MNGGRDTAHRVAIPRRIEALSWHGAYFHAFFLGFGHVLRLDPLHRNYLYVIDQHAMIRFPDSKHRHINTVRQPRDPKP